VIERRRTRAATLELEIVDALDSRPSDVLQAMVLSASPDVPTLQRAPRISAGAVVVEDVEPAVYDVWIAAARGNAYARVEVRTPGETVRERILVAGPGRIRGRVDFEHAARPARVAIEAVMASAGHSLPGAREFQAGSRLTAEGMLDERGEFELTHLTPGRWRVWMRGEGLQRSTIEVEVAPDSEASATLVAGPASVIEVDLSATVERGWVLMEFSRDGGPWIHEGTIWSAEHGLNRALRQTVEPGRLRWRVLFLATVNLANREHLYEPQEGELELAPGEQKRIAVDVVPVQR
jgi:hypothetical protein